MAERTLKYLGLDFLVITKNDKKKWVNTFILRLKISPEVRRIRKESVIAPEECEISENFITNDISEFQFSRNN